MPISCHFPDCEVLVVTSLTHKSSCLTLPLSSLLNTRVDLSGFSLNVHVSVMQVLVMPLGTGLGKMPGLCLTMTDLSEAVVSLVEKVGARTWNCLTDRCIFSTEEIIGAQNFNCLKFLQNGGFYPKFCIFRKKNFFDALL